MEMELNRQKIAFYNSVYECGVIHEENGELIIPDSSPDMVRVVSSSGDAYVKEKRIENGHVVLNGTIVGFVLYVAEGEDIIRKLDVNMPFSKKFEDTDICKDAQCIHTVSFAVLEAREINSRKIALRAHTGLNVNCYMPESIEYTDDIANKDEFSVEVKNKEIDFYMPVFIRERSFTIIDDMEIPSANSDFETMLENEVSLSCTDKKIIGNKAVIKGIAGIKCTYMTKDGMVNTLNGNLPFSQIMDVDEIQEDCDLCINMNMRASEIEPSHDMSGDTRFISVNILVDSALVAYAKGNATVIDDLYSTAYEVVSTFENVPINKKCVHINERASVNETIETANPVKKILNTGVILAEPHKNENKICSDAYVQIMYVGDDNGIYCVHKKCNTECDTSINQDDKIICVCNVSGESASGIGNKITVQFHVDYDIKAMNKEKIRNLKSLNCGEMIRKNSDEAMVIIKHIYNEQPLWNIAKKYNTTVNEIADANGLDFSDTVAAGSMLLIPCGK